MKKEISKHPIYLRLREVLGVATDREMAEKLDVTPQSVNGWKRTGKIRRSTLESVARLTGVSFAWLFTGEGAKYSTEKAKSQELTAWLQREGLARSLTASPLPFHSLPVVAELVNHQLRTLTGDKMVNIPEQIGSENSVLITVQDDTWIAEGLQPGDLIVAESPNGHDLNGRTVIAVCDGRALVRKFEQRGQLGHFTSLLSGQPVSFPTDNVSLAYLVTAIVHPH
ncbi:MAG: helix-turn-helix domain-containing protein [Blastocatellia bacterium]